MLKEHEGQYFKSAAVCNISITSVFLMVRGVSPMPNPPVGDPPLVYSMTAGSVFFWNFTSYPSHDIKTRDLPDMVCK
jgi:hypothetical protein